MPRRGLIIDGEESTVSTTGFTEHNGHVGIRAGIHAYPIAVDEVEIISRGAGRQSLYRLGRLLPIRRVIVLHRISRHVLQATVEYDLTVDDDEQDVVTAADKAELVGEGRTNPAAVDTEPQHRGHFFLHPEGLRSLGRTHRWLEDTIGRKHGVRMVILVECQRRIALG